MFTSLLLCESYDHFKSMLLLLLLYKSTFSRLSLFLAFPASPYDFCPDLFVEIVSIIYKRHAIQLTEERKSTKVRGYYELLCGKCRKIVSEREAKPTEADLPFLLYYS